MVFENTPEQDAFRHAFVMGGLYLNQVQSPTGELLSGEEIDFVVSRTSINANLLMGYLNEQFAENPLNQHLQDYWNNYEGVILAREAYRAYSGVISNEQWAAFVAEQIITNPSRFIIGLNDKRLNPEFFDLTRLPPEIAAPEKILEAFREHYIQKCFLAGTPISMWDGTEKPIEFVKPGDVVVSYDQDGKLVPGRVSKTKENRVKYILDVFGLMVTPGHVTLCGDGKYEGQHVPIIDILRSDSALVLEDGSMKRAATNFAVGSIEDRFVQAIVTEDVPGTDSVRVVESGQIRLGTRFMHPTGADITVLEVIQRTGGSLTDDGYVVLSDGITKTPFVWTFTNRLPKPEDFVLQRSQLTLADIYEADEWEAVAPQVPPPYRGEAGPSFASINGGLKAPGQEDNRPPNIPVSMRGSANQPTMSRKQRRAHEAKQRKQAKRMVRTAN